MKSFIYESPIETDMDLESPELPLVSVIIGKCLVSSQIFVLPYTTCVLKWRKTFWSISFSMYINDIIVNKLFSKVYSLIPVSFLNSVSGKLPFKVSLRVLCLYILWRNLLIKLRCITFKVLSPFLDASFVYHTRILIKLKLNWR